MTRYCGNSASSPDVVCFGTLIQRGEVARASLYRMLDTVQAAHVFYDVNIRLDYYPESVVRESLQHSTIVKLNAGELILLSRRLYGDEFAEEDFAERLSADYGLDVVCVTKEADGCTVYAGDERHDSPAPTVKVADTVGAGDAFRAGFLQAYCSGKSIAQAASTANAFGRVRCIAAGCGAGLQQRTAADAANLNVWRVAIKTVW